MDQHSVVEKMKYIYFEIVDFVKNVARELSDKGAQKSAAALTYMTLFALVPMMTVMYSMFSIIPAFDGVADQLNSMIFDNFVPQTGDQIKGYLADFSSQARNLTGFGVAMLFVTAYLMLTNIEKTFNSIWGVKEARKGLSSFLLYWAVLSIGPFMLGAGILISTYLISLRLMVEEYDQLGLTPYLFRLVPLLMTTSTFTLLFAAVPNCKVPLKSALIGGFVTAVCFEFLKFVFGAVVSNTSFKFIYGAFAVVPLFLVWINLLWITVLVGAVFVRALSEQDIGGRKAPMSDIRAVLLCLAKFRAKAQSGEKVVDEDCLSTGVSLVHWQTLRTLMVKQKWIVVTDSGGYSLCRDLRSVSLWDVACLVNMPIDEPIPDIALLNVDEDTKRWLDNYFDRRGRVEGFAKGAFDISVQELFAKP